MTQYYLTFYPISLEPGIESLQFQQIFKINVACVYSYPKPLGNIKKYQ